MTNTSQSPYLSYICMNVCMYMSLTLSEEAGATQSLVELQRITAGAGVYRAVMESWIGRPWRRTGQYRSSVSGIEESFPFPLRT